MNNEYTVNELAGLCLTGWIDDKPSYEDMWEESFGNLEKIGKAICIALDEWGDPYYNQFVEAENE